MKLRARFSTVFGGLALALILAILISPFASSAPDGLEKVAQVHGFFQKEGESPLWQWAIFPGYGATRFSSALFGFLGTLTVFVLVLGVAKLFSIRKK